MDRVSPFARMLLTQCTDARQVLDTRSPFFPPTLQTFHRLQSLIFPYERSRSNALTVQGRRRTLSTLCMQHTCGLPG